MNDPAPKTRTRRQRRELVTWVALGLLVAVALAVVSRLSTDTARRPDAAPPHGHHGRPHLVAHDDAPAKLGSPWSGLALGLSATEGPSAADPPSTTTTTTTTIVPATTTTSTKPVHEPATTTTSVPPPTTTPGPLAYRGALAYPSDVATSVPFNSPSGIAAARVTWSGGNELVASLSCRGARERAPGRHGISISIDGEPRRCAVSVALGPGVRTRVAYTISLLVPAPGR